MIRCETRRLPRTFIYLYAGRNSTLMWATRAPGRAIRAATYDQAGAMNGWLIVWKAGIASSLAECAASAG
jgi:hypothetical protein